MKEVEEQQRLILSTLNPCSSAKPKRIMGILAKVLNYDEEVVKIALGEFGIRLRRFVGEIDEQHPGINEVFDGQLASGRLSDKFCELLKLAQYAKDEGLTECMSEIGKLATKELRRSAIPFKFLDSPQNTKQFLRFLPDKEKRDKLRELKGIKFLDLGTFYKKGILAWEKLPQSFSLYVRYSKEYKEHVEKNQKKSDRFSNLGCIEMAEIIRNNLADFVSIMDDDYYGFHRISITNMAVILAKMHSGRILINQNKVGPILIRSEAVEKFEKKWPVKRAYKSKSFIYSPKIYPAHKLPQPENIKRIIEYLEFYAETGNRPVFDHYLAIVPTMALEENDDSIGFDIKLIENKAVVPALAGEKDGKCFFLCYWI
jgi:hypothetical protein